MWRRLYFILILVRLYFALSPSYIHPDEHFQGPEVIAGEFPPKAPIIKIHSDHNIGEVLGYPIYKTWEFTSSNPLRSIFPFWIVYGWPLTVLRWIWEGLGYGPVPPMAAFYTLRGLMFLASFILGDWAIHELLPISSERKLATALVSSSYVTWTYQTHTFSNSVETLVVLWTIVLCARLRDNTERTLLSACFVLAFLLVLGLFNRVNYALFVYIPLLRTLPSFYFRPLRIPIMAAAGLFAVIIAITMDTEFYTDRRPYISNLLKTSVITPWNNLTYNMDPINLAEHGLHPFWQHFVANLPQLIGPAFPLVFISSRKDTLFWSAIFGTAILSCIKHQEARFLLPAVPLILSSIRIPRRFSRVWIATWIFFNVLAGTLFGVYHQGGVVPAQTWIAQQESVTSVFWWKTYNPPRWLLDGRNTDIRTVDLMGMPGQRMLDQLKEVARCESKKDDGVLLIAPLSATFLDSYLDPLALRKNEIFLREQWRYNRHIGLDDLDFGDDGVWPTLKRVIGRRGLAVWVVNKKC